MLIRPAARTDLDAVMACEREPGYEALVVRWTREQHAMGMADPTHRYLLAVCRSAGLMNDGSENVVRNGEPSLNTVMSMRIGAYRSREVGRGRIRQALTER